MTVKYIEHKTCSLVVVDVVVDNVVIFRGLKEVKQPTPNCFCECHK